MRVFVVSFAVHAAAFALVMRVPRRERPPEPPPTVPIEIVDDEPPSIRAIDAPAEETGAIAAASHPATNGARGSLGLARATDSIGEASTPEGNGTSTEPAPVWSGSIVSLTPKELGLGTGRENPFLPKSPPPIASNKPDLGLGFRPSSEGPALSVLRDVTSRSLAPLDGRARFTVRVDEKGDVLGIDLDDATGGTGWDDARRMALEEMKNKKIFLPHGARGLNVRFEIVSELSFPTGQKTAGQFGLRDEGNPLPAIVLPDESNIGQKRTRKVHAHHLGTEIL